MNMKEEDILDYLMSSEFSDGMSDQESQFLLLKFRQHYRLLVAKNEQISYKLSSTQSDLENITISSQEEIEKLTSELKRNTIKLDKELDRKLTIKERLIGKIKRN